MSLGDMFNKCIVVFLCASFLFGATATWISPVTPEDWDTAGNWNPATPPTGQDGVANFTSPAPPANPVVRIGTANTAIGTIHIDGAQNYTFAQNGAGTLQINVSSGSGAINVTAALGNGANTFSVPISLLSALIVTHNSTGNLTISGAISGANSLTKAGTGTLILTVANTYSGGTIINAGKLNINGDDRLGSPNTTTVTISNGTLEFSANVPTMRPFSLTGNASIDVDPGFTATLNGVVSGAGSLTKADSGTLVLTAANTYQGGTTVGGGILSIASDANLGTSSGPLNFGTGTLQITSAMSTSRSGTISGNAIVTSGAPITFNGAFGGAGSLTVAGGGTFTLVGANSYTGGTTVNAATQLAGTTTGLQGNIATAAVSSLVTFSQNFNGTYAGSLSGPGLLTKLGTGVVTFTGSSPFTGPTSINAGGLIVNGSLASSAVTVAAGAALGGAGTVGSTLTAGLLDPGNGPTIGTLSINGTLTMNAGASTLINIAPLAGDRLAVIGAANITGPLVVEPVPGFYGFSANYTILTSAALAGTFSPVTSTVSAFVPTVTYTATSAILSVNILEPFAIFPFSNRNTQAVGRNIDALSAAGQLSQDLINIFNTFVGQSNSVINEALDEMHPAPYSAFTEMQAEVNAQLISLFHRLPYLPCCCRNPNRLWIEGFGNTLHMKAHGLEIGFQANSGGLAFGYDGQISDYLILGLGGAWTNNHLDWQHHRGHGIVNGLYGGAYFDSQFGDFYLGGALLAGLDFYDTTRHMEFVTINRRATADFKALDITAQLSTAYLFGSPQAFFYPYANFDYLYLHTYSFSENGAGGLNLNVFNRTDGTFRTEMGLGLQVQDRNAAETICISPLISLGWVNMCPVERPKIEATFEGASIPFKVFGWDQSWNLFNINFGLSFAYRCFSVMLDYNAEFSPDSETVLFNQHGNLRLDWKW